MSASAVSTSPRQNAASSGIPPARDSRLRYHAVPFLILVLAEILVGNQLALAGTPYPVGYLAAHIGISTLLIALGAYLVVIGYPLHRARAWAPALLGFVSVVVATLSGTDFLVGGGAQGALYAMEGFGGLALLAALVLVILGSFPVPNPPSTPG
jgi:hypothetical protein